MALYAFLIVSSLVWLFPIAWAVYQSFRPFEDTAAAAYYRALRDDKNYAVGFEVKERDNLELPADSMIGDMTLFHRSDMVETSWQIATPILDPPVADAAAPRSSELSSRRSRARRGRRPDRA